VLGVQHTARSPVQRRGRLRIGWPRKGIYEKRKQVLIVVCVAEDSVDGMAFFWPQEKCRRVVCSVLDTKHDLCTTCQHCIAAPQGQGVCRITHIEHFRTCQKLLRTGESISNRGGKDPPRQLASPCAQ
jgi:hypothetical protein